jgi:hypothetical protein
LHLVVKPAPAVIEWFRHMLAPLRRKPFIPIDYGAKLIRMTTPLLKEYMVHYNIPWKVDPVFGELVTFYDIQKVYNFLYEGRTAVRTDPQRLLQLIVLTMGNELYTLEYSQRLSAEISRIAKLAEPLRTQKATHLYLAWKDATSVAQCLEAYRTKPGTEARVSVRTVTSKMLAIERTLVEGRELKIETSAQGSLAKTAMMYWGPRYLKWLKANGVALDDAQASGASSPSDTSETLDEPSTPSD